eukprot:CAMPEP_0185028336 /NCGR_PEP_ID=MMETSP1103-20130426/13971_1 /TAXON_ID=36769 /ORGANISM="Paraphysomonas bandaiensis, Strain Caron Lab Isolate" /LENGTH=781 /DNA_ID=CAMNT_0027562721 /DNA_START=210 /DNA_END=2555 /DNA_ORIENTATION=-
MLSGDFAEKSETLIVFMFAGLTLGAFVTHVLSRLKIGLPYTVVVFFLGCMLSLVIDSDVDLGHVEESIRSWKKIDPELLLYLFLPALLFGEAMSLKWYHVKAVFSQALILAGPGVLIGAYLMALILYFCFPLNWPWYLCMVFGSIVAATDPVAVVALLKNAGASPKLTILIIGESLMNDGTAMVLFTLYYNLMKGDKYDAGEVIEFFLAEVLGAPLLGIAFGLLSVYWLSLANNPLNSEDMTIQIGITVCCAYLTFFVAQYECEVSGVLACVSAGIMFAWMSPPLILEHETMHSVWGFIEWVGNTIIFLLAGVIIGGSKEEAHISSMDWLYCLLLYIALMIVRCLDIAVIFPFLSRVGLRCDEKDAKFMAWAGLRGALAVALSLIIYADYEELGISQGDADKVFFYVGGIAALTLLVNATTAQALLSYLGLLKEDNNAHALSTQNNLRNRIRTNLLDDVMNLDVDKYSANFKIDSSSIIQYNSLLSNFDQDTRQDSVAIKEGLTEMLRGEELGDGDDVYNVEMLAYYRTMFLESIRVKYWKFIADSKLPREAPVTQTLLYSIDSASRRVRTQGRRDWFFLVKEMELSPWLLNIIERAGSIFPEWAGWLKDVLTMRNLYFKVYVLLCFIDAHEYAEKKFTEMMRTTSEECWDGSSIHIILEQKKVLSDSKESVECAKEMLMSLDTDVVSGIIVQQSSRILLARQTAYVRELVHEGLMKPKDADKFFDTIAADSSKLDKAQLNLFKDHVKLSTEKRQSLCMNPISASASKTSLDSENVENDSL